ncbi:MAG: tetratricopeptide repeat protein [Oceanicaulis sp.]
MRAALIILVGLTVSGCTSTGGFLAPDDAPQSAYGSFLAGRYAGASRDLDASSEYYAEALEQAPGSALITGRAFLASLMAGDFDRADDTARAAAQGEDGARLARLYLLAADLAGGTVEPLQGEPADPFGAMVASVIEDWKTVRGSRARALEAAETPGGGPFALSGHLAVHRALLFESARDYERAEQAYRAASGSIDLHDFTTVLYGEFLERRGRRADAIALYQGRLAQTGEREDPEVAAALDRVRNGRRAPRFPRAEEAAARAIFAPSALLTSQAPVDYTALYLRLVQRLDPDFARNTMALGAMLEGLDLLDAAVEAYESLDRGAFAADAAVQAAWLEYRQGRTGAALDRARDLAAATRGEGPRLLLADMLRASDRCEEAAEIYRAVHAEREAAGREVDWHVPYFAGLCLQRTEGWAAAEPWLVAALDAAPDEPRVLNHLGYNWIVIGERVEEGFDLVARAAELAPENGAILDSLGWGHFKQGRIEDAVLWLERAIERSPEDPTINWHLGDAYAASGRTLEARFQWNRALELDPDPREQALLERRLEFGLSAGPADLE